VGSSPIVSTAERPSDEVLLPASHSGIDRGKASIHQKYTMPRGTYTNSVSLNPVIRPYEYASVGRHPTPSCDSRGHPEKLEASNRPVHVRFPIAGVPSLADSGARKRGLDHHGQNRGLRVAIVRGLR
jgi:hypothetical protein